MTLGCGSIGGNITSDNISPLHLINIKRLAYGRDGWRPGGHSSQRDFRPRANRCDSTGRFIGCRSVAQPAGSLCHSTSDVAFRRSSPAPQSSAATSGSTPAAVSFVCEDDVRQALRKGEKIYVTPKSIITPAARDLGTDKDVLVFVS